MIKTANSNVSPAEVEMEMQQLDGVHSAYVVGMPDAERGQLLVAAVVPREGACWTLRDPPALPSAVQFQGAAGVCIFHRENTMFHSKRWPGGRLRH